MNKVYLIGNLTRDPELAETSSGIKVCRFAIAVNRTYAGSDGNRETDFFNITVWRTQAENCGRYLKKGSKVAIVGSLQNRSTRTKKALNATLPISSQAKSSFWRHARLRTEDRKRFLPKRKDLNSNPFPMTICPFKVTARQITVAVYFSARVFSAT